MGDGKKTLQSQPNPLLSSDYRVEFQRTPIYVDGWNHTHDSFELYFNSYGGKTLIVGEEVHVLQPGSVALICPNEMHGHYNRGLLTAYERASIYLTPEFLKIATHEAVTADTLKEKVASSGHFYLLKDPYLQEAIRTIEEIPALMEKDTPLDRLTAMNQTVRVLLLFLRFAEPHDAASFTQTPETIQLIRSVIAYIEYNFSSPISVDQIAHHFNISRSYLSHTFYQYVNHGVYDYIQLKRIAYAMTLINRGEALSSVAISCGFSDYSCFLRAFTKRAGCSPNQYRNRSRESARP